MLKGVLADVAEIERVAGSVRLPLFVVESVPVPVVEAVNVNVADAVELAWRVTDSGLNTPHSAERGVSVTALAGPLPSGTRV